MFSTLSSKIEFPLFAYTREKVPKTTISFYNVSQHETFPNATHKLNSSHNHCMMPPGYKLSKLPQ